jgi:putative ABC transport system permease protein
MVQTLPMRGGYFLSFAIEGRAPAPPGEEPSSRHRVVSPRYFESLGVPLRRGRVFDERDVAGSPMVAVIDQAFAARYFPGEDPIGRGLDIGNGSDGFYQIVGIVGNVRHDALDAEPGPTMYVPYKQDVFQSMWLAVRTDGEPAQLAAAARAAVPQLDAALPAARIGPLTDALSDSIAQRRFSMLLLVLFAAIAAFLAAVGLYGVVAYAVAQRTRELGVRMAVGARAGDIVRLVVGGGMRLALLGVALGTVAALGLSRILAALLFEITPFDPASYAATALGLLTVAAAACAVPALRAARVDPLAALRQE